MDHGYGGHPYPSQQQQQYTPPPPALHGAQYGPQGLPPLAAAQAFYPPPAPLQYPYPSMPYPHAMVPPAPLQQQQPPLAHIPQQQPPGCGFFNPWEPPPPFAPPPADPELQKCIEKLVEYAAKNGPEFEKMLKEKQKDNPAYAFLFGAEGYGYYRYKLWITVNPHLNSGYIAPLPAAAALSSTLPPINPALSSLNPAMTSLNPGLGHVNPAVLNSSMHSVPMPPAPILPQFYEQHQHLQQPAMVQPYFEQTYETGSKPFKGLAGPLPTDVAVELQSVLDNLTGTKESIKGAKNWFMQRSPFAPALAEALRERVLSLDDDARQLHVIYLANDILFESLQRRMISNDLDNESSAFQPVLGSMLAAIYHNPQNKEGNQTRLRKILQFWASKEVYSKEIISALESEMVAGLPAGYQAPQLLTAQTDNASAHMLSGSAGNMLPLDFVSGEEHLAARSSPEPLQSVRSPSSKEEKPSLAALVAAAQYGSASASGLTPAAATAQPAVANTAPTPVFPSLNPSLLSSIAAASAASISQPSAAQHSNDPPPYPLFPPGLIPGMVRKMQIGSGVPYSALSPLDIPAVIPPSTVSDSYILDRVAKFFKEIGEVDPLEGQVKGNSSGRIRVDDDEMEERDTRRTGGACIPPPPSMHVDSETNTLPDGSMEHKPGSINTGRLGLGAVADPNEISQYDDVYTSYRKQRSTSYHTFMSARAAAR